ncbi:MAG: Crp/Fnr family transcriptional regulator [Bacteroidota bacterium]
MKKRVQIKKGQILQRKGEFNTKIYVVKSGLLRSYAIDQKGKEHVFMFALEGWVLGDNVSPSEPGELFIDALEDTEAIVFEKAEDEPNVDKLINRLKVLQKRIIMLMSTSAIERYDYFMNTYPDIAQRIPQRMIASYLGITPEALSKLKAKRKKNRSGSIHGKS